MTVVNVDSLPISRSVLSVLFGVLELNQATTINGYIYILRTCYILYSAVYLCTYCVYQVLGLAL